MKVTINRDECIGCGLCADTCPEVFGLGDDNLVEILAQPTAENESAAKEAADDCPASVIEVEE